MTFISLNTSRLLILFLMLPLLVPLLLPPLFLRGFVLCVDDGAFLLNPARYRHLVGRLPYLNFTRIDITFVVHQLSQFFSTPRQPHWDVAIHLLRYLKGSSFLGLFFPTHTSLSLKALLMLIELRAQTLNVMSLATVFILALPLFPGNPRNRQQFLVYRLRPNIIVWQLLLVSFNGVLAAFSLILVFLPSCLLLFDVIIRMPFTSLKNLFSMNPLNISKSIVSWSEINTKLVLYFPNIFFPLHSRLT